MLEIVKVMAEFLAKLLDPNAISTLLRERGRRKAGAELFLVYASLMDIVVTGDLIVRKLKAYCEKYEKNSSDGADLPVEFNVQAPLHRQLFNLASFGKSADQVSVELSIIDPDASRALSQLIDNKGASLASLCSRLNKGKFPLVGPTESAWRKLGETYEFDEKSELSREITDSLNEGSLSAREDKDVYGIVSTYLSTRNPDAQLDEIAQVANQIRTALEMHFSITDVLVEIQFMRDRGVSPSPY